MDGPQSSGRSAIAAEALLAGGAPIASVRANVGAAETAGRSSLMKRILWFDLTKGSGAELNGGLREADDFHALGYRNANRAQHWSRMPRA
jgi:hypothetical protein